MWLRGDLSAAAMCVWERDETGPPWKVSDIGKILSVCHLQLEIDLYKKISTWRFPL